MTAAAASDDRLMLETFERLALAAGREVMRVFHAGCAVDRGRSRVSWALTDAIVVAVLGDLSATFSP